MSSEHLKLLIAGHVLGDLDPTEAAEFEQLLETNPAIAQEVRQMQQTLELSADFSEIEPPSHLRSAILNAQTPTSSERPIRRRLPWNRILNAAAAAVIVTLGIQNYSLRQTLLQSQTETQRLAALNFALQGTAIANSASAKLAVNPNTLEAVLAAENLPLLPPGKVYVLWTVLQPNAPFTVDSKNAILTTAFTVDAQGNASQSISVPKVYRSGNLVTRVAVTVEDAAAPQRHQGNPVLSSKI